jgi:hypothetical protein
MPKALFKLPPDFDVELLYLAKWPNIGDLQYFQSIRSGAITEAHAMAVNYHAMTSKFVAQLSSLIPQDASFDAILMPPSSRRDAVPYKAAVHGRAATDISPLFKRSPGVTSGNTATTMAALTDALSYQSAGDEKTFHSLLIVDESVASGKTIAAIVHHLRAAGLPPDCKITVAAPAWFAEEPPNLDRTGKLHPTSSP